MTETIALNRGWEFTETFDDAFLRGGGVCAQIRLPKSLEQGGHVYSVSLQGGAFTAADGAVSNPEIAKSEARKPVLKGEWDLSGLCCGAGEQPEAEASVAMYDALKAKRGQSAQPEAQHGKKAPAEIVMQMQPQAGGKLGFDLALGARTLRRCSSARTAPSRWSSTSWWTTA